MGGGGVSVVAGSSRSGSLKANLVWVRVHDMYRQKVVSSVTALFKIEISIKDLLRGLSRSKLNHYKTV